jgi:hypothetical protein
MKFILTAFDTEQPSEHTVSDIVELDLRGMTPEERFEHVLHHSVVRDILSSFMQNDAMECTMIRIDRTNWE